MTAAEMMAETIKKMNTRATAATEIIKRMIEMMEYKEYNNNNKNNNNYDDQYRYEYTDNNGEYGKEYTSYEKENKY